MAKTPERGEGAVIRSRLSRCDRGCRSLWSPRPRAGLGPRPPLPPAPANAQLLLPDLESWELPVLHILKGQSGSSLFCIHTEEKPQPYKSQHWLPRANFWENATTLLHCVLHPSTAVSQLSIL